MDWTAENEDRLRALIRDRTLMTGDFTLASGRKSTFIFNLKNLFGHPEGAALMTGRLLDRLSGLDCDHVAGLELGAVFPVAAVVQASHARQDIHGFVIRKKAKGHGTLNRVEGLTEDDPRDGVVVVIDDVTTTGNSLYEAVEVVRDLGFTVDQAITLVDREEGAMEGLAKKGIELIPLFKKSDFLDPSVR